MKPIEFRDALKQLLGGHAIKEREIQDPCDFRLFKSLPHTFKFQQCIFCEAITVGNVDEEVTLGLEFDRCTFKEPLIWPKVTFRRSIRFASCRFTGYVDLTGSHLYGISLKDCTFGEKAYFEEVEFDYPSWIHVSDTPSRIAEFGMATFKDGAEFNGATFFVSACFMEATFEGATTFVQARFREHPYFGIPRMDFSYAQIFGYVEFQQSLGIHQWRNPPRDIPSENEIPQIPLMADFRYVHVHTQHGLRFHTENLTTTQVIGTNLDACHFSNVRWPMVPTHFPLLATKFALRVQHGTVWKRYLSRFRLGLEGLVLLQLGQRLFAFAGCLFTNWLFPYDHKELVVQRLSYAQDHSWCGRMLSRLRIILAPCIELILQHLPRTRTYLQSCMVPRQQPGNYDHVCQVSAQQSAFESPGGKDQEFDEKVVAKWRNDWTRLSRAYRDLKNAYEGNRDYIYASDFHYAEKELRRINHEVPRPTRFQLQLYWLVSGYGERVLRPVWWFLLIWFLSGTLYFYHDSVRRTPSSKGNEAVSAPHNP